MPHLAVPPADAGKGTPRNKDKKRKADTSGEASKASRRFQTPFHKALMAMSPEDRVGAASDVMSQKGGAVVFTSPSGASKGREVAYNLAKIKRDIPKNACVQVWISGMPRELAVCRCPCKGEPGHEFDGTAHQVTAKWTNQWGAFQNRKKYQDF